jgi:hypothetical protein
MRIAYLVLTPHILQQGDWGKYNEYVQILCRSRT